MEIKTVWAVYFSGTGTTEKVATHLAKSLAGQLGAQYKSHDYTQPKGRENALQFGPDELVVLGTPGLCRTSPQHDAALRPEQHPRRGHLPSPWSSTETGTSTTA